MTKVVPTTKDEEGYELRGGCRALLSEKEHEVMLCGPSDTGKTVAACIKTHLICLLIGGVQGAICRKSYASMRGSVLQTFNRIIQNQGVTVLGGEHPKRYVYPNGSTVWIGGMDNPDRVLSSERDFIYVNQAEELTLNDWETLATRCSGRASIIEVPQLFGDCNPSGAKHWIRVRAGDGKMCLINSTHKDNPDIYTLDGQLTEKGIVRLAVLQNLTGVRKKRLFEGIWATAEGAVYDNFDSTLGVHVKVRDWKEMKRWFLGLDEGYTNPAVILLIGEDSDGRRHCFREFYKTGILQGEVVQKARVWFYDPLHALNISTLETNGTPRPSCELAAVDESAAGLIADLRNVGVNAVAGKGRVLDGIHRVQDSLTILPDGLPRYSVDPSCLNHINEFESYIWKPGKDEPQKENDHTMDALRYLDDALGSVKSFTEASIKQTITGVVADSTRIFIPRRLNIQRTLR